MHLRGIKLRGFKSFVEPIELTFEPGVSVIVGPNGSGKSNISDAIVWAAGSLAPTELRADKPDDVIFAGGGARPPADGCEVELLFEGVNGRIEGLDYHDVSLARRLHRGGEGQYLVNRAAVRRTDLVELLADIGLGGAMHSIIGQGRVEAVLSSRPHERRELIEEAAGLGKFKRRRHRAELKLARVAIEVERARDVEAEVRKRMRPLALQATAAERSEKLAGEIARLRARLATLDIEATAGRLAEADTRRQAALAARDEVQSRLAVLLEERERAEEELADAAGTREAAAGELYRLRSAAERIVMRRESAQSLVAGLRTDLDDAQRGDDTPRPEVDAARRAAAEARAAATVAAGEREAAVASARAAYARVVGAERRAHERASAALEEILVQRRFADDAAHEREARLRRGYALDAAVERVGVRRETASALHDELRAELGEAEALAARGGPSPADLERAANEAAAAARSAAAERETLAESARAARERLDALERSLREREGIPPAARTLAAEGERLALTMLMVEGGAERAVAAALAWRASAVLARDPQEAFALVERARREGLGTLAVVLAKERARGDAPVPGARPLRELVTGDEGAVSLLAGAWLVEPSQLLDASHGIVVTRDGHGYDADRGELWFSGETAEVVLLEVDRRRRAIAAEAQELASAAERAGEHASRAADAAQAAEAAYAEVATVSSRGLPDAETLARLTRLARRLDDTLAAAVAAASRIDVKRDEAAPTLADDLRALAAAEVDARREASALAQRLAVSERTLARLGGTEVDAEHANAAEAARLLEEAERVREIATAAEARAAETEAALADVLPSRRRGDATTLARLVGLAERLDATLAAAAAAAEQLHAPLRARVEADSARTSQLASELRRLAAAEADLRNEAAAAGEHASAIDVEIARIEAEADEARRRLAATDAEPAETDEPRDELAVRVERLERRREQLGAVNPFAKEEYEAEKLRLEELSTQRKDLEASLDELEKLRAELTETVERRFEETFEAVSAHFSEVASTLFPGGHGRLFLREPEEDGADEDAEAGIEVELKPAGKKVTRLSLLSGGEKALGAISFLFALFLARPCPFYLLDEVEAALDDTNIGRFVELLRRYSDRAQFIVVTHQKRTMEAADVLYGVTMGADGVSQVVSRRLPREEGEEQAAVA